MNILIWILSLQFGDIVQSSAGNEGSFSVFNEYSVTFTGIYWFIPAVMITLFLSGIQGIFYVFNGLPLLLSKGATRKDFFLSAIKLNLITSTLIEWFLVIVIFTEYVIFQRGAINFLDMRLAMVLLVLWITLATMFMTFLLLGLLSYHLGVGIWVLLIGYIIFRSMFQNSPIPVLKQIYEFSQSLQPSVFLGRHFGEAIGSSLGAFIDLSLITGFSFLTVRSPRFQNK